METGIKYGPLCIVLPALIIGKIIYHNNYDSKISWDETLPNWIEEKRGEVGREAANKSEHITVGQVCLEKWYKQSHNSYLESSKD